MANMHYECSFLLIKISGNLKNGKSKNYILKIGEIHYVINILKFLSKPIVYINS